MQYFFISGAPSTGKTMTIHALCGWLLSMGYTGNDIRNDGNVYTPSMTYPVYKVRDFSFLFNKNGRRILLHSATDDAHNINLLAGFISEYNPDIVISSCRDYLDWPRDYLCQKLNLENGYELSDPNQQYVQEFPLGKITRRHGRREEIYPWYFNNTLKNIKKLLMSSPYNL